MVQLIKLDINDGYSIYEMLKDIGYNENSFTNPVNKMSFEEYKTWVKKMFCWDRGEDLPEGFVRQSVYWLCDETLPVGFGKIRHELTESSREEGGNIGYAIRKSCRGKGYGTILLKLLLDEARKLKIEEKILTVDKGNEASKAVIVKNGGVLFDENDKRWYYRFD